MEAVGHFWPFLAIVDLFFFWHTSSLFFPSHLDHFLLQNHPDLLKLADGGQRVVKLV